MTVSPLGAAWIWLDLLLPNHWPVTVAGLITVIYRRRLNRRILFFIMACLLGYGVQGLLSVMWPVVWMIFFDGPAAFPKGAIIYLYAQSLVSALLTIGALHVIATQTWQRLYPK
jgi:hypothetical protein